MVLGLDGAERAGPPRNRAILLRGVHGIMPTDLGCIALLALAVFPAIAGFRGLVGLAVGVAWGSPLVPLQGGRLLVVKVPKSPRSLGLVRRVRATMEP